MALQQRIDGGEIADDRIEVDLVPGKYLLHEEDGAPRAIVVPEGGGEIRVW